MYSKMYSSPCTVLDSLRGLQGVETPRIFTESAHEGDNVVRSTHRLPLEPGEIPVSHLCYRLSRPQSHNAAEELSQ